MKAAAKKNATKKRIVTTKEGVKYEIAPREEAGLVACTGDAHRPEVAGMMDNCMVCAPRWGEVMSYKAVGPEEIQAGFAVPVFWERMTPFNAFEAAEQAGTIRMVWVTEKTRSATTSYNVWVKA